MRVKSKVLTMRTEDQTRLLWRLMKFFLQSWVKRLEVAKGQEETSDLSSSFISVLLS